MQPTRPEESLSPSTTSGVRSKAIEALACELGKLIGQHLYEKSKLIPTKKRATHVRRAQPFRITRRTAAGRLSPPAASPASPSRD